MGITNDVYDRHWRGFETHPHTQTAVHNFLDYIDLMQIFKYKLAHG